MDIAVDDRRDIEALYVRYCYAFDDGKADIWAEAFTPDGAFCTAGNLDAGIEPLDVRGASNLAAFARETHRTMKGRIRHLTANIVLEPTPTGANGTAYVMVLRTGKSPKVAITGRYIDELVKDAGGWRFRSRDFVPDP